MELEELLGIEPEEEGAGVELPEGIHTGVSVSWLMAAFRMDRATVKRKVASLPPVGMGRGNSPLYDFVQASSCLVKPKVDLEAYLKTLRPQDLPPLLQKEFWDAKLKRQRWEVAAGELWHTADVVSVLGDTFQLIKNTMMLWAEHVDREVGLSDAQRECLTVKVDHLQNDIYENLVRMAETRRTPPSSEESFDEEV